MCYDPRQYWPTLTKDSYFPLRKLDLNRFAEATKTIWINNWIFGHFGQTSSQLSKLLSHQDFTKDYSKSFLKYGITLVYAKHMFTQSRKYPIRFEDTKICSTKSGRTNTSFGSH